MKFNFNELVGNVGLWYAACEVGGDVCVGTFKVTRRNSMSRILIIDDDACCRDSVRTVLMKAGHCVDDVEGVDQALEALDHSPADLVVSDCRMPIKSGLDLLKALRNKETAPKVLLLSAHVDAATEDTAIALGAAAVVRKPVKRKELIDYVMNALSDVG
jgi:DNA-binding NtrC family response regulator